MEINKNTQYQKAQDLQKSQNNLQLQFVVGSNNAGLLLKYQKPAL